MSQGHRPGGITMKRTVSVFALVVAALCIAPVAQAQNAQPAESAPAAPAQPPAPPSGYPPPPPRYPPSGGQNPGGYQNQPPTYWAPAQPRQQWTHYPEVSGVYRPFSFTLGVGPGYMHG